MKELSIIVPVLNEAAHLADWLAHLQPLRQRGVEIIVVDGGSEDDSPAMAAHWGARLLVSDRGRARQMNAGAGVAQGDILLFLHADTWLPSADGGDSWVVALAGSGRPWGRFAVRIQGRPWMLRVVAGMMNIRSCLTGIATGDQAIFVRRELFLQVGGFPDQPLMEDIALSRRLLRLSPPLCLSQRVTTSGRRWEKRGVWRTILLMWWLRWSYWRGVPASVLIKAYPSQH
ncbi:MAG: TIGR04283 family arsenosugar biosynthesis glycosyltransferase [Magnetococcales bacterium]|nr:TIGR04283 family arsenosugar biosynthesis glycosyltransferase [Magnetococcales bacterium]